MGETYPDGKTTYSKFSSQLHKLYPIINIREKHNGLHRLVETEKTDFYCIFKKEFFMTFNNQFEEFTSQNPEYKGVAETINVSVLLDIQKKNKDTVIIFLYKNTDQTKQSKKYAVYPKIFWDFATTHQLIREQEAVNSERKNDYSGEKKYHNEVTAHLPFKKCFFHNFEEWIEKEKNARTKTINQV